MRPTEPQLLTTARRSYSIPTLVIWDGGFLSGDAVKGHRERCPMWVISDSKRFMGTRPDDPKIQRWKRFLPFPIGADA
jgi:molecular chaperone DnaK (HSP70)